MTKIYIFIKTGKYSYQNIGIQALKPESCKMHDERTMLQIQSCINRISARGAFAL